jgi:HD-GYP domain-containing protein (c-di-GMP phosphodiesterase class II)
MTKTEQEDRTRRQQALERLVEGLEARDPAITSHSRMVALYSASTARQLGLSAGRVERVWLAGVLHDVGKVTLADAVLYKPGPLTVEEWAQVRRHPETGGWIVSGAGFHDVAGWVMGHHERYDGAGYPHGLAGDDIPLEARILAVADAYEAMTTDRVYRRGVGHEAAMAELMRCAGGQFDPAVVEAFVASQPSVSSAACPASR